MENKSTSEEEILRKHISETTEKIQEIKVPEKNLGNTTDLKFINQDIKYLPCGKYYPAGTILLVRPCEVKEIQNYSMVDDNNAYDIIEKMNDMLQACVRLKYPDGKMGTYLDIKDQDRIYLIFMIRELTFQKGSTLGVNIKCSCGTDNRIELRQRNFRFHPIDPKLEKYYNKSSNSFVFRLKNGKEYQLTPPTIGLQKNFTDYIIKENNEKRPPNLSFLKIIPFLLQGRSSITFEGIQAKLKEYEKMDDMSFQFLNDTISRMTFGIKEIVTSCSECDVEVHTDMQFPEGASGIFVVHGAFEEFIAE